MSTKSLDRRRAEIECLNYWPKELAAIVAEYSVLDRQEKVAILMPSANGTLTVSSAVKIHWASTLHDGYQKIFLRRGGIQSRAVQLYTLLYLIEHTPHQHSPSYQSLECALLRAFDSEIFKPRPDAYMQFIHDFGAVFSKVE